MYKKHYISCILLMGGTGNRFNNKIIKQFYLLNNKPLFQHSLDLFLEQDYIDEVILVCHPDYMDKIQIKDNRMKIIKGGKTRQESSFLGLKASHYKSIILIHDAARPFISKDLIKKNIEKAITDKAVSTCLQTTDTIFLSKDQESIDDIPNRNFCFQAQTPQTFIFDIINEAHENAIGKIDNASDDCSLVKRLNIKIKLVNGNKNNIKITTIEDIYIAEKFIKTIKA